MSQPNIGEEHRHGIREDSTAQSRDGLGDTSQREAEKGGSGKDAFCAKSLLEASSGHSARLMKERRIVEYDGHEAYGPLKAVIVRWEILGWRSQRSTSTYTSV